MFGGKFPFLLKNNMLSSSKKAIIVTTIKKVVDIRNYRIFLSKVLAFFVFV
jgi:hypothetical protein